MRAHVLALLLLPSALLASSPASSVDPLAPPGLSPLQPHVVVLESLAASAEHTAWLRALVLEQAPQARVTVQTLGEDLASSRAALLALKANPPAVILFGYGHEGFDRAEWKALSELSKAGVLLVAPAGNQRAMTPYYPASYPMVLGVASSDHDDHPSHHSTLNFGVKLLALGEDLPAPLGSGLRGTVSGSSYAAARAAGMAARLLAEGREPKMIARDLKRAGRSEAGPRGATLSRAREPFKPKRRQAQPFKGAEEEELVLLFPKGDDIALRDRVQALGGRRLHFFNQDGLIAELGVTATAQLWQEGLLAGSYRRRLSPAQLGQLKGRRARTGRLWNNAVFGDIEAQLPPSEQALGAPVLGCTLTFTAATADAPLQPMGLYIPSPPIDGTAPWATSSYLAGRVAVGIVLPESNGVSDPNRSNWTQAQIDAVLAKIMAGAAFMDAQNPGAQIEFVYDIHTAVPCDYEPILHDANDSASVALWVNNTMAHMGQGPNDMDYVRGLRAQHNADWSLVTYVVNDTGCPECFGAFPGGRFAFARLQGYHIVMTYTNDGWGISGMAGVFAHEAGHSFGALDEYSGGQAASARSGYFHHPNENAYAGGTLNDPYCPMAGWNNLSNGHFCAATRLHVGWRDSDVDGRMDMLDTHPAMAWAFNQPTNIPLGSAPWLSGTAFDSIVPTNSPWILPSSLLGITQVQFRLNGSAWSDASFLPANPRSQRRFTFNTGPVTQDTLVELRAINSVGNSSLAFTSRMLYVPTLTGTPSRSATFTSSPTIDLVSTATPDWTQTETPSLTPSASPTPVGTPYPVPCWLPMTNFGGYGSALGQFKSSGPGAIATDATRFYTIDGHYNFGYGSRVTVWDRATLQPIANFGEAYLDGGRGIAVDDTRVYVTSSSSPSSRRLAIFDKQSFAFLGGIANYGTNYGQSISYGDIRVDEDHIYMMGFGIAAKIMKFDRATGAFLDEAPTATGGGSVMTISDDTIYVAENQGGPGATAYRINYYDKQSMVLMGSYNLSPISGFHMASALHHFKGRLYAGVGGGLSTTTSFPLRIFSTFGGGLTYESAITQVGGPTYCVEATDEKLYIGNGYYNHTQPEQSTGDPRIYAYHVCQDFPSYTPTAMPTATVTPSFSASPTPTESPTISPTHTVSPTPTPHNCGIDISVCFFGCDQDTLSGAFATACDGDRILIKGGLWLEPGLTLDKSVQLVGLTNTVFEGIQPKPVLYGNGAEPILQIGAGRSITITNLAFNNTGGGDLLSVSMSAASALVLERIEFKKSVTGTGTGLALSEGSGSLRVRNSSFVGFEAPSEGAIHIDTAAGFSGSADIQHNTFISASPAAYVRLSATAAYSLLLSGNLFHNRGPEGGDGLYLAGDALATGDFNAWWGYSSFYGSLTPGANDKPDHNTAFWALTDHDIRYGPHESLAWAGSLGYGAADFYGNTRPSAGQSIWSIGAAEPVTATDTPSVTPTGTPSATETATPTPTDTPTATPTRTASPTPTVTRTATLSFTESPTLTVTRTVTQSHTESPTRSPTRTITESHTESPTRTPSGTTTESHTESPTRSPTRTASQTLTPLTLGCQVRAGLVSGNSSVGTNVLVYYTSFTPTLPGGYNYIEFLSNSGLAGATVGFALYDDNGFGAPSVLRAETSTLVLGGAGTYRLPITPVAPSTPTIWLAIRIAAGSGSLNLYFGGGNSLRYQSGGTFPGTASGIAWLTNYAVPLSAGYCAPTPTTTPSFTASGTITATRTISPQGSPTDTPSATGTWSVTESPTISATVSATQTVSETHTESPSPSASPTASPSGTPSASPTATRTATPTGTPSRTPSFTPSFTVSPTVTPAAQLGILVSNLQPASLCEGQAFTLVINVLNSGTGTASNVTLQDLTQTGTASMSGFSGPSPSSATLLGGVSASFTFTGTALNGSGAGPWGLALVARPVGDDVNTGQPVSGANISSNAIAVCAPSPTPTLTPTATPTYSLTASPTATPTVTPTASRTLTLTLTATPSSTPTVSPSISSSDTPSPTASPSPNGSSTFTPTISPSPSATPTATPTATPSRTLSLTLTPLNTATATPSLTPTRTATPSLTITLSASVSPTQSPTYTISETFTPGTANVAPKDLLAPVPALGRQPVRLYVQGPPAPSRWRIYNLAGERVAELSFQASDVAEWAHNGAAAGVYLIRIEVEAPGGPRSFWQKVALLP